VQLFPALLDRDEAIAVKDALITLAACRYFERFASMHMANLAAMHEAISDDSALARAMREGYAIKNFLLQLQIESAALEENQDS
jgi:hypothetical protein